MSWKKTIEKKQFKIDEPTIKKIPEPNNDDSSELAKLRKELADLKGTNKDIPIKKSKTKLSDIDLNLDFDVDDIDFGDD